MILAGLVGVALDLVFELRNAVVLGLCAGLLVAQFVPTKASCALPRRDDPVGPDGST